MPDISLIIAYLEHGWWTLLSYGGLAIAGATWFAARFKQIPDWLGGIIIAVSVGASLYAFGWTAGDSTREIRRLESMLQEQIRQREIYEKVARNAQERLGQRIELTEKLQEKVDEYREQIQKGKASASPSDDAYNRIMRSITIGTQPPPN